MVKRETDDPQGAWPTGRAAYSQALETAIERPGELNWHGIQDMSSLVVQQAISAEDALSFLKPYIKNTMPAVVLKALSILDTLAVNCGTDVHLRLAGKKWTARLAKVATSQDQKIRSAGLQLLANWAHKYRGLELGDAFTQLVSELHERGFQVPPPLIQSQMVGDNSPTANGAGQSLTHAEGGNLHFERGMDFLNMSLASNSGMRVPSLPGPSVNTQQNSVPTIEEAVMTVQRIKIDVHKLLDAIQRCTETATSLKAGSASRKEVLDQLNLAWVAAEKCNVWAENMQSLLMRELDEENLSRLLEANDMLNSGLERWQALVSLDIANMGVDPPTPVDEVEEAEEQHVLNELGSFRLGRSTSNGFSEYTERQVRQLREQNEILKRDVAESSNARNAALAQAKAKHQKELRDVRGKAVRRIKELRSQINELEEYNQKLARDREDAMERLDSARKAVSRASTTANDEASRKIEALEVELERSSKRQRELEVEVKRQRSNISDLEIQISDKVEELEAAKAEKLAVEAHHRAEVGKISNELNSLRTNAKEVEAFKQKAEEAERSMVSLKLELKRESILRKKAYNQIREMKGNIRVLARIRPAIVAHQEERRAREPPVALERHDDFTMNLRVEGRGRDFGTGGPDYAMKRFEFDACFGPSSSQAEVYAETSQLIQSAFDGYNVCIFCYGQTGSGKTYTITGEPDSPGIIPRAMEDVFAVHSSEEVKVVSYMLELYQDSLLDLLGQENHPRLRIKTDPASAIVHVEGATIREAQNAEDLKVIFEEGLRKRKTAATRLNIQSSRSHLIFTMLLECHNKTTGAKSRSKITFVDLAGSERVARSGAVENRERLNEAKAINKSLSALGDVVAALTSGEAFIPYRNHKLTELMRDSLGGNAKTLMIVNVSPLASDAAETKNSLEYASRVKQVANEASRSFETREIARLKALLDRQTVELRHLRNGQ